MEGNKLKLKFCYVIINIKLNNKNKKISKKYQKNIKKIAKNSKNFEKNSEILKISLFFVVKECFVEIFP